jgi:hypothetical protein
MKEISKKELMEQMEMGELAYKQKGTQDTTNKIPKFRPIFREDNETDVPDAWELNPTQQPGAGQLFVPTDCEEVEAFIEKNKEWLDELGLMSSLQPMLHSCKRTKYQPRNAKAGTTYVPSGEGKPAETKIKIQLNRLVEEYLGNPEVSARLERLSIPEIKSRDRKHLNKYGRVDNDYINYQTHTFNSYLTGTQFLKFVTARVSNKKLPDEYKSYHLARQFNQNYRNWDETTKNQQSYVGKTDAYKLDKFGFDEDNLDVTVRMDLAINGKLSNNQYVWTVKFKTKFGRKLKEERWLSGLELDKDETITKTADLEPGTTFDDKNTVMDSLPIKTALIEALDELRSKIMNEYKPVEMLKKANIKQYDITNRPQVNEGIEIAKQVIEKINSLKKLKK